MHARVRVYARGEERLLSELPWPLPLDRLAPGRGPWEVELGFGKGRYLLRRALAEAGERRFLGIEMAARYYRLARDRARKRGADDLVLLRGEALFLLGGVLPRGFAEAVHVYFPDPWPKDRHRKRRLFEEQSVDLVLGLLAPAGRLCFATDHADYGWVVRDLLETHGGLRVESRAEPWADGPRTNYEAKYLVEGRPIVRLEATALAGAGDLHPRGRREVLASQAGRAGRSGRSTF